MGKIKTPDNVDVEQATIGGCLKQIRRSNGFTGPEHVPAMSSIWVCEISPQQTKKMVDVVEKKIKPLDLSDYTHAKRFRKVAVEGTVVLQVLLCSATVMESKDELLEILRESFDTDLDAAKLFTHAIPDERPMTKEQALRWSEDYWPLSWKGNPNQQDLITARFDLEREQMIIDQLLSSGAMATILAKKDPATGHITVLHIATDNRKENPLHHSVMNAIAQHADGEKAHRASGDLLHQLGYLCHDLLVYTTHEPCTMCAMALVHSRVGQLVYIWPSRGGAIELSHFIGDRRDLNWTFDIWRWIGSGLECPVDCAVDEP